MCIAEANKRPIVYDLARLLRAGKVGVKLDVVFFTVLLETEVSDFDVHVRVGGRFDVELAVKVEIV